MWNLSKLGKPAELAHGCQGSGLLLERIQSILLLLPEEGLASHMGLERKWKYFSEWRSPTGILMIVCIGLKTLQDKYASPFCTSHEDP